MATRFRLVRRLIGAMLALVALWIALVDVSFVQSLRANSVPVRESCDEFIRNHAGTAPVQLTGCTVDMFSQSYLVINGEIRYLIFPLRAPGGDTDTPTPAGVVIGTPDLVALAKASQASGRPIQDVEQYEAALEARVYHRTDWSGPLWQALRDKPRQREAVLKGNKALATDADLVVIDGGDLTKPPIGTATTIAVAALLAGLVVLAAFGSWRLFAWGPDR
jgi:hypothetical protein